MHLFRVYGTKEKPADPVLLSAGPVKLLFDNGEIRYLRLNDVEVLRRVYVGVRDRNWGTIAPIISGLKIRRDDASFEISYQVRHSGAEVQFVWDGRITGKATGEVTFEMIGRAGADFSSRRTGFCVLHPRACVGQACIVEHTDGSQTEGLFPRAISPHQPFKNIRAIRHNAAGADIRVLMEGDVFEMEDQRNWSDASYKTYCRPQEMPQPFEIKQGQEIKQTITIQVQGQAACAPALLDRAAPIKLDLTTLARNDWLAQVGLAVADDFDQLDAKGVADLKSMHLRHLRLDVDLASANWLGRLTACAANLQAVGVPLEVALTCPEHPQKALREFAHAWPPLGLKAATWLILGPKGVTERAQIEPAREALSTIEPQALFGGGTDAEFVAVNRQHPPMEHLDMLSFAVNPQVHSVDTLSIIENLQSHADLVDSAIAISGDRPVAVSPITLKRRPKATTVAASADTLPSGVDPRQMSLLAGGWTIGSLSRLCNADFLTYFETNGWRGIMQGNSAPAIPRLFPSSPGDLFPVYHVLKSFLSFHPEQWSAPTINRPLELAAIHLLRPDRHRLLIANLTPSPRKVALTLLNEATLTVLDAVSVDTAFRDPNFWVNASSSRLDTTSEFELGDYAIAAVDWNLI